MRLIIWMKKMVKTITKTRCDYYSRPDKIEVTNTEICTKTEIAKKILPSLKSYYNYHMKSDVLATKVINSRSYQKKDPSLVTGLS